MGDLAISTIIIIGLNVLLSMKGFKDRQFFYQYSFNLPAAKTEKLRFLSSGFLHVDSTHLLVNMLTLYFFADVVIYHLGEISFVIIYLASLLIGNIVSYFFHKDDPQYLAVGASGAVMGILYSAILLQPDMMLGLFFIIPIPAYVFGIGYLLYSIYGMKKQIGNIGHDAHIGGAAGGYLITLAMAPILFEIHTLMVVLLAIPLVLLFILVKMKAI